MVAVEPVVVVVFIILAGTTTQAAAAAAAAAVLVVTTQARQVLAAAVQGVVQVATGLLVETLAAARAEVVAQGKSAATLERKAQAEQAVKVEIGDKMGKMDKTGLLATSMAMVMAAQAALVDKLETQ